MGQVGKKQCPACGELVPTRSYTCPHCDHVFATKTDKTVELLRSLSKDEFKAILFLAERVKRGQLDMTKPSDPAPTADDFAAAVGNASRSRELVDLHRHHKAFALVDGLTKKARERLTQAVEEVAKEEKQ